MLTCNGKGTPSYKKKRSICIITETPFSIQTQLRNNQSTAVYEMSACGCNNNTAIQQELFSRYLPWTYAGHVGQAACQSGEMATSFMRERFMLPLGELCPNVLRCIVHLYLCTVINFITIFIVNFSRARLYNQ